MDNLERRRAFFLIARCLELALDLPGIPKDLTGDPMGPLGLGREGSASAAARAIYIKWRVGLTFARAFRLH